MLSKLHISGYKCLMEAHISCEYLNVMVGSNASGKSSLLQTILLLKQSVDPNGGLSRLVLSGPLYEGGTAQDVLHPAAEHAISLFLATQDQGDFQYNFALDRQAVASSQARELPASEFKKLPRQFTQTNLFAYLNAERIGPRISSPLPTEERMQLAGRVGKFGEYTAAVLARSKEGPIFDGWIPSQTPVDAADSDAFGGRLASALKKIDGVDLAESIKDTDGRLDLLADILLGWIIPGASFVAAEAAQNDSASIRYLRDLGTEVRPTHIGFGLSYTLPIIVAALAINRGGILIVENPEAHLHPYSQSRIGVFLAIMAATGRQIFVETHSDHVVNGMRLAIKYEILPPEHVAINFFARSKDLDRSVLTNIHANAKGKLSEWPTGFFDQIENDLSRL